MKDKIVLCVCIILLLSGRYAFAQWSQTSTSSYGKMLYSNQGALGYGIRTATGGGWAWQLVDADDMPYFHVEYPTSKVGIGTATPRGKLDVDGPGDIYLSDDVNAGTGQALFLPGHIYIAPYNGTNVSYVQARRHNDSGNTSLRFRTFSGGMVSEAVHIAPNGYVGISNTNPQHHLDVGGILNISGDILQLIKSGSQSGFQFHSGTNNSSIQFLKYGTKHAGLVYTGDKIIFKGMSDGQDHNPDVTTGNMEPIDVLFYGNVGVGVTAATDKLTIDGRVRCEEVKVEIIAGSGPDYVFEPTYNLLPLSEVETYIKANKHLPEVPSAKQMEEEGLNLKEMNLLLLKKVEELTLHLIEKERELNEMKRKDDAIIKRMEALETQRK